VPTYQYACTECGEPLEIVQKFSDDPLTDCPACAGRLRKVFSPVGIVFKGSGFYRTDSRSGRGSVNGAKDVKAGESSPADAGSAKDSSGGKTDSKPAAASPSGSSSTAKPAAGEKVA